MHIHDIIPERELHQEVRNGFVRAQSHPGLPYMILNYTKAAQSAWRWNRVTKNARGLIFNHETGEVIARPFPKFFNYDEEKPTERRWSADEQVVVTDKLDGSLGILYPDGQGSYAVATRGSFTSEQALEGTRIFRERYADSFEPHPGYTYLFEIIYPENRIVVDYGGTVAEGARMARVLGRARLSRSTEESTSIERQKEAIEQWAALGGHDVVGWAIDEDVSGDLSPFETPELGPWLQPDRLPEWDFLVAYRLDRISRRVIPLNRLFGLCLDTGKAIVSTSENIDLSHWVGRLVANVIAGVAEGELEAIQERTRASRRKIASVGRWHGGAGPYGYRPVKRADGWFLEVVPDEAKAIRFMAELALAGESRSEIARRLDEAGVPPRRAGQWHGNSVGRILRSRWVLGQYMFHGRVVVGDDGLPLQAAEPVLDERTWQRVQAALDGKTKRKKGPDTTGPLLDVAWCVCGRKLYHHRLTTPRGQKAYRYWRCASQNRGGDGCGAPGIPAEDLEGFVEERFLSDVGDHERTEPVFVPGTEQSDELDKVKGAIDRLRKESDLGLYDDEEDRYLARLQALVERRRRLEEEPTRPARWERRGLGETFRQSWERMDDSERRQLLLDAGVTVKARARPFEAHFHVDVSKLRSTVPSFTP